MHKSNLTKYQRDHTCRKNVCLKPSFTTLIEFQSFTYDAEGNQSLCVKEEVSEVWHSCTLVRAKSQRFQRQLRQQDITTTGEAKRPTVSLYLNELLD